MHHARLRTLLAVTLTALALVFATPAGAQAARRASADILSTPRTVYVSGDLTYIDVRVKYRCRNTKQVRYYLTGQVSQDAVPETYYSIGYRGVSGIVPAKCTRRKVRQTLRLVRSWWWGEPDAQPRLQAGWADFRFHLDARAATGPGWYQDENPDMIVQRTVHLVTP
jgi:hypothetical protein